MTKTLASDAPSTYDPSQYPPFAVTVDLIILTVRVNALQVLLIERGEAPFKGMLALPGGFKRPTESLAEAANRELLEETGVSAAQLLTQFGAYGDPARDPRMDVVTVAYLAVLPTIGDTVAGTDAARVELVPVADVLSGARSVAFDHQKIIEDAVGRLRQELDGSGIATAFVGPEFTLSELRAVYEAAWGFRLDSANFRRSVLKAQGWVVPAGRTAALSPDGGRPGEVYTAGRAWRNGSPIRRDAGGATEQRPSLRESSGRRNSRPP